jgi:ABC-type multidrug transport system fused ATPase/permease subunit
MVRGAAFGKCTVLAIAHRLETVLTADQVLVLARGRVVESGKPADLLANPNGVFHAMHAAATARGEGVQEARA